MVDDVLGGVVGHVLLDGNLGNMMDLVVDLVSNMLNNWGSGNSMDSWDSSSICNSWGSNGLALSSSASNWSSSIGNSWGSNGMNSNSLADWINESILVKVLRESLKSN